MANGDDGLAPYTRRDVPELSALSINSQNRWLDDPDAYGSDPESPAGPGGFNTGLLWRALRKYKWLIALIALAGTLGSAVLAYRQRPQYKASAKVEIGSGDRVQIKSGDVVLDDDAEGRRAYPALASSRLKILSRPLLEEVVVKLGLDQDNRLFDVNRKRSLWEACLALVGEQVDVEEPQRQVSPRSNTDALADDSVIQSPEERRRLARFAKVIEANLEVEPIPDSRVLEISFRHTDPQITPAVADCIAETFVQRSFRSKTQKYNDTAAWLERMTLQLKNKVEASEAALARYSTDHNIFATDGKETITTDKVSRLNEQLQRAETDRMLKQSLYEEVQAGRTSQLPESLTDPQIVALENKIGDLAVTAAQLNVNYGPNHPKVLQVKEQMNTLQQQLDESRKTLSDKIISEYQLAARNEQSLRGALERAKNEATRENQDAIQLNILRQDVDTSKSLYTSFLQRTHEAKIQLAEQHSDVHVIEPAELTTRQLSQQPLMPILMGFSLFFGAGTALALFLEYRNRSVRTTEDVARYGQLKTLGVVPPIELICRQALPLKIRTSKEIEEHSASTNGNGSNGNGRALTVEHFRPFAEVYGAISTSVMLTANGQNPKLLLVTSAQPGEGKTMTTVNLAMSLADLGASVLIVDCDFRNPQTHNAFGIDNQAGLSNYLSGELALNEVIQSAGVPKLSVIPSGPHPPNPARLLLSRKMKEMLSELQGRFDYVLVDSPPVAVVNDPVILASLVEGVILVLHGGKSTRESLRHTREELANVGANICGVVLNNVDLKREGFSDYCSQYAARGYGYGAAASR